MAENLHDYELVVIAVPQLDEQALATLIERVSNWITSGGGYSPSNNVWGRRRLAYAINKRTDGIYVQYNFQMNPSQAVSWTGTCGSTSRSSGT